MIIEHFRQKTAGKIDGQAKAMVVTRSRLHAVRHASRAGGIHREEGYDQGERPLRTLVAFFGSLIDPDWPEAGSVTEASINRFSEAQLPKKFHGPEYQVLVVAEKYQTGFDEPLLHTMYVDKKLSGVAAVQTLSRLNRTHPGKEDTFVLDFANSADEIKAAFEPFFEESFSTPTEPNVLALHDGARPDGAGVLSMPEMEARSARCCRRIRLCSRCSMRISSRLSGGSRHLRRRRAEGFRRTLEHFCRAYAFVAQVMPGLTPTGERLFLYGRLLLLELPPGENTRCPRSRSRSN